MSSFWRWPLFRQLAGDGDGTGAEAKSDATRQLRSKTATAKVARSVCPYCGVGCGQLVYHERGRVLAIEGEPESPINQGTVCPKGSASLELVTQPARLRHVMYRAPGAASWRRMNLDEAMDLIAERIWESRRHTFVGEGADGERLGHTTAIAHLGGATLDNEENYLIKKLFTAGLGMVCVSNQARI
jgi:formate dehydrogenase major subunit